MVDKELSLKVHVNFNRYGLHSYAGSERDFQTSTCCLSSATSAAYKDGRPGQAPAGPHDRMNGRFNVRSGRMENPSATGCSGSICVGRALQGGGRPRSATRSLSRKTARMSALRIAKASQRNEQTIQPAFPYLTPLRPSSDERSPPHRQAAPGALPGPLVAVVAAAAAAPRISRRAARNRGPRRRREAE